MAGPSSTSRGAYLAHVIDGKAGVQRQRLLDAIRAFAPISRNELAELFSPEGMLRDGARWFASGAPIRLGSVCGRVNLLLGDNEKAWPASIRVHHVAADPITKHRVDYLEPIETPPDARTFKRDFLGVRIECSHPVQPELFR